MAEQSQGMTRRQFLKIMATGAALFTVPELLMGCGVRQTETSVAAAQADIDLRKKIANGGEISVIIGNVPVGSTGQVGLRKWPYAPYGKANVGTEDGSVGINNPVDALVGFAELTTKRTNNVGQWVVHNPIKVTVAAPNNNPEANPQEWLVICNDNKLDWIALGPRTEGIVEVPSNAPVVPVKLHPQNTGKLDSRLGLGGAQMQNGRPVAVVERIGVLERIPIQANK